MPSDNFHEKPFDEGTLTKLRIFELYAREWLPVFLARESPRYGAIHLFDFFAGPGADSRDSLGSPLRLLHRLQDCQKLPGWNMVRVHAHFFDGSAAKIQRLEERIAPYRLSLPEVKIDVRPLPFEEAFAESTQALLERNAAKLVFIDQFGVDHVTPDVFRKLVGFPACDFLFFISSSTLYRFRDHPAIKQKVSRPDDYFHIHRAVLEYYRDLLPSNTRYFLAPFSIKKGANIYGLIFGSAHPLGIDKFLQVAWSRDEISGEADFDIDRDAMPRGQMVLPFEEMRSTKMRAFEEELEQLLRDGKLTNEVDVIRVCFEHGVKRQHAQPTLARLKKEGVIDIDFRVPDIRRWDDPRPIRLK